MLLSKHADHNIIIAFFIVSYYHNIRKSKSIITLARLNAVNKSRISLARLIKKRLRWNDTQLVHNSQQIIIRINIVNYAST